MATLILSGMSFLVSPILQLSFRTTSPLEDFKSETEVHDHFNYTARIEDELSTRSDYFDSVAKVSKEVPAANFGHVAIDDHHGWCDVKLVISQQSMRDLVSIIQIVGTACEVTAGFNLTEFSSVGDGKRGALCVSLPTITVGSIDSRSEDRAGNT